MAAVFLFFFPDVSEEPEDSSRQRRRWDKDPPERLLSVLEKAQLKRAFSTFVINRGGLFISEYKRFQHEQLSCSTKLTWC